MLTPQPPAAFDELLSFFKPDEHDAICARLLKPGVDGLLVVELPRRDGGAERFGVIVGPEHTWQNFEDPVLEYAKRGVKVLYVYKKQVLAATP